MTKERRKSVVSLVEPSFQFLLATSEAFAVGPEDREKLFSEKFLGAMLKEATQDATLTQKDVAVRSAGRALSSHRPAGRRQVVREPAPFQQPYQRQREPTGSNGGRRGRLRGARGAGDSWSRIGQRYEKVLNSFPHWSIASSVNVGARLLKFTKNWEVITDDRWVLDSVASGVTLDFLKQPRRIPFLVR